MENNKLLLYGGNDPMEAAMLRSVLLFNCKIDSNNRRDMMLKAILAIIIYGNGTTKISDIEEILRNRFGVILSQKEIPQQLSKIKDLINQNNDGTLSIKVQENGNKDFFNQLDEDVKNLIDGVIERIVNKSLVAISVNEKTILKKNIQKALSCYYSTYGYRFFGVSEKPGLEKIENAVEVVREGLNKKVGQAAVRAIADLLINPTKKEYETLQIWARAYVTMEVMNLDPMLRNFKETKISKKEFVIDTDVALHAITTRAKYSEEYRLMVKKLRDSRCKLYIPSRVVEEILDHADAAWKWYSSFGPQVVEMTDELLDSQICNVFITDYVKLVQEDPEKRDMSFDVYLDNYRSSEYPSLIWDCLTEVFGDEVKHNHLELVKLDAEVKDKLKNKILEETMQTDKGIRRSPEKNEELAELDTSLYLTLMKMNQNEEGDDKPLSRKTYLLTDSNRTNKCAKGVGLYQKDICCDPKGLLVMMQEIGSLNGHDINIINLFENPFLAYTANEIWKEVDPILKEGVCLKNVELRKLRLDVDSHIDRILTCKTVEEKIAEAQRQIKRGYLFAQELVEANKTIQELDNKINEQSNTIQIQSEEIEDLKQRLEKKRIDNRKEEYKNRLSDIKKGKKGHIKKKG